ncbi:MAG: hypothetical protein GY769_07800 [bacterium]|nr:hypothetical protein [bacterium]
MTRQVIQPGKSECERYIRGRLPGFKSKPLGPFNVSASLLRMELETRRGVDPKTMNRAMPLAKMNLEEIYIVVGWEMEQNEKMLEAVTKEATEAREFMERAYNQVRTLSEEVRPLLMEQAKEIRAARMTVTSELGQALQVLKDVRKFFLEKDYTTEMERLQRFVELCWEFQDLKQQGVLDAMCDAALRLAVAEPDEEEAKDESNGGKGKGKGQGKGAA